MEALFRVTGTIMRQTDANASFSLDAKETEINLRRRKSANYSVFPATNITPQFVSYFDIYGVIWSI